MGDFLVRKGGEGLEIFGRKRYIMRSSDHKRDPGRGMLFYKGGYNTKNASSI